jgi:hypothetical protein
MNDPAYQHLVETAWRRELTPEEARQLEDILKRDPSAQACWQMESALNSALGNLTDCPLPSNLTSQVLHAVCCPDQPASSAVTGVRHFWRLFRWQPVAWAAAVFALAVGGISYHSNAARTQKARDIAKILTVPKPPSPDILQDFDAVMQLSRVPEEAGGAQTFSDEDLLAALK